MTGFFPPGAAVRYNGVRTVLDWAEAGTQNRIGGTSMKVRRIVKTGSLLFLLGAIVLASAPGSALAQFETLTL